MTLQKTAITPEPWELIPNVTWQGRPIYRRAITGELAREEVDRLVELPPDAEAEIRSRLR